MKPVVLILGPTAGGKTRLAAALARQLPGGGECVSADSMQVFRDMDVGTAKPTRAEQAGVPHHLLDLIEPSDDTFSVDRWLELAHCTIAEIQDRGHWPIVVGGTNLYVQAFLKGMLEGPEPDPVLRARLYEMDAHELRSWLERVDPQAAQRIHLNDRKRTVRAIEVFEKTGTPLSHLQTQWNRDSAELHAPSSPLIIGLEYPVAQINQRINLRVKHMIDAGLVEEVRRLHASNSLGRNAREALGYQQVIDFLEGCCSLEDAIEQMKIRTRRYAKQQRTWLRRFRDQPNSVWIPAAELDAQQLADTALAAIFRLAAPPLSPT